MLVLCGISPFFLLVKHFICQNQLISVDGLLFWLYNTRMNSKTEQTKREWAVGQVTNNWRIRQRLPRITALAVRLGLIALKGDGSYRNADRADNDYRN
jgi:hypothetical protein